MIALTGLEEEELRAFFDALPVKPPLVGLLRQAVRVFLTQRAKDPHLARDPEMRAWVRAWHRRHPPFVIEHGTGEPSRGQRKRGKRARLRLVRDP